MKRKLILASYYFLISGLLFATAYSIVVVKKQQKDIGAIKKEIGVTNKKLTKSVQIGKTLYYKNKELAKSYKKVIKDYKSLSENHKKSTEKINQLSAALNQKRNQPPAYVPADNSQELKKGLDNVAKQIELQTLADILSKNQPDIPPAISQKELDGL